MQSQSRSYKFFLMALIVFLLASLACSVVGGNNGTDDKDIQQTMVSLELTKIALENIIAEEPDQPGDEGPPDVQPPVETAPTETILTPEPASPDVSYEGISFSFDQRIALGVDSATIPGQNLGDDFMPFETYPTHYKFILNGFAVSRLYREPMIHVFPVNDYRGISQYASDQFDALQAALANRPGGSVMSSLPYLPLVPAAQIFSSQVRYFDFQNGTGIRYLTLLGQDVFPVDNQNLLYTYQGITHDGQYYIAAVFPITHSELPEDGFSVIDDHADFYENFDAYLTQTIRLLGEQSPDSFVPSLILLDEMMASFSINR